ncbi:hypothetical protein Adt_47559 [Abeliophyllum distichum]|uniref:Uncharacterized protein n=1 Tax=Abeliophyllum distichum TaxID=126358 RepID=A0ABD1NTJ9_9LAMI
MSSTNMKLGLENEALRRSRIDALARAKAALKMTLEATKKGSSAIREQGVRGPKRATDSTCRKLEKRAIAAKQSIALVNCNFNAMVLEKDWLLTEAMAELVKLKEEVAKLKKELAATKSSTTDAEVKK